MKILITGATGFVGKKLTNKLTSMGHEIHVLTRDKQKAKIVFPDASVTSFEWKNNLDLPPIEALIGINGVINLMGENIAARRWTDNQKKLLKESRVNSTENLVKQIESSFTSPLDFFISASAIGIYPVNISKVLDEDSRPGETYLAGLCRQWEAAMNGLTKCKRKVIVRTGVVLEKDGGALKKMLPPFLLGLGGPVGDGNQMMSWIHHDDLVEIYINAALDSNYNGVINATSPNPVSNYDFTKALGSIIRTPTLIPIPKLFLKIVFGEMSTIILDSQTVVSKRLEEVGFKFKYETITKALNAIFQNEKRI